MYGTKKTPHVISKNQLLPFPNLAHLLKDQDQGGLCVCLCVLTVCLKSFLTDQCDHPPLHHHHHQPAIKESVPEEGRRWQGQTMIHLMGTEPSQITIEFPIPPLDICLKSTHKCSLTPPSYI